MGRFAQGAAFEEVAVLDVGSNSVRLVVYRLDAGAMTPILNEKVMAGLGRNLRLSGRLSPEGIDTALAGVRRFRRLVEALGVTRVEAVATAAVRDAQDGSDFAQRIERETGWRLEVIPGEEEARLSALGVLAGAPAAVGVVGDLGGSSLELIGVGPRGVGAGETHPLGPLSIMDTETFAPDRAAAMVDASLLQSRVLQGQGEDFYAVGGAWRALGRIDIALRSHPLGVLHHHVIERAEALKVADFVKKQSRRALERLEEAAAKRADTLPYAAVVLERVLRAGDFKRVILSSYGLREGLLYSRMRPEERAADPLVASAAAFGASSPRARRFGEALDQWIAPVFEALSPVFSGARDKSLRAAAARLADLGGALHPDQRGEIMFDLVLRAPFAAISHDERAFLATAVHHRYVKAPPQREAAWGKLLNDDQRRRAAALGGALRLGADLSGRSESLLSSVALRMHEGVLVLTQANAGAGLVTDAIVKRLDSLAGLLGLEPQVR